MRRCKTGQGSPRRPDGQRAQRRLDAQACTQGWRRCWLGAFTSLIARRASATRMLVVGRGRLLPLRLSATCTCSRSRQALPPSLFCTSCGVVGRRALDSLCLSTQGSRPPSSRQCYVHVTWRKAGRLLSAIKRLATHTSKDTGTPTRALGRLRHSCRRHSRSCDAAAAAAAAAAARVCYARPPCTRRRQGRAQ